MKIAITTPTGHIGSGLVQHLLDKGGHELTLLCRDPEKVKQFTDKGAKAVQGDLSDGGYVTRATEGADLLFWLTPPKFDEPDFRAYQNRMGDIAAEAVRSDRIQRVVHLSSIGAQHADGTGPIAGLHDIEQKLNAAAKDVGGSVTHLRPASFFENYFMSLEGIKTQGAIYMPVPGDARMAMIATRDIAAAAAEVVLDESWSGVNVRDLLGPKDYSFDEVAKIIGEAAGKDIKHVQVPGEATLQGMQQMGINENTARTYLEMYEAVPKGLLKPEAARNEKSTTPTTFEEFARQAIVPALQ
ncbi:MAG: NmrA family NAD(P)-binding protein [Planctomycetes bacterium]|nr:NmrA family NAD(P)-binding protein [Planctomycetota bacterium]